MIIAYKYTHFNAPTTFLSRGFPYLSTWTWSVAIVTSRTCLSTLLHRAVCCSVLQCVAVCQLQLQRFVLVVPHHYIALFITMSSALQYACNCSSSYLYFRSIASYCVVQCCTVWYREVQCVVVRCNMLHHIVVCYSMTSVYKYYHFTDICVCVYIPVLRAHPP